MVRKIKDAKKEQNKIKDTYELKREKEWDERFIYNKYENNQDKRPLPKKAKTDFSSNIKYLKEQMNSENVKKNNNNKTRGKSGFKIHKEKNNTKIKINGNYLFKNVNMMNRNDLNNTDENPRQNSIKISGCNISIGNNIEINNKYYSMSKAELEICLEILWNKLAVKESYTNKFNKLKSERNNEESQKEFLVMEVENLEKLENFLKNMYTNIDNREKTILLLKKLIEVMEKQFINLNLDIRDNILNDFYVALNAYRINTIKVVENIDTYRQLFSHSINKGKFHEKILMKKYGLLNDECVSMYKGNYLLKINDDVNFLGKSKINGYKQLNMNFSTKEDPFLLNISEIIPINKEFYSSIKQGQYIIMQEIIYEQINSDKDNIDINNKSNQKTNLKEININKNNNAINLNNKFPKKEKEKISCVDKSNDKQIENNKIKKTEKIIIETQLIDRNNYENFFGKNDPIEDTSEEQTLADLKKGLDYIHSIKKNKKQKTEEKEKEKKLNHDLDNIKEEIDNKHEEEKEEKNKIEESNKIEENINDKIEEKIEENKINNNDEEKLEKENTKIPKEEKNNIQDNKNINEKSEEIKLSQNNEDKKTNNKIPEEKDKEEISIESSNMSDTNNGNQPPKEIVPKEKEEDKVDKEKVEDKVDNDDIVNIKEKEKEPENIKQNKDNNIDNNSLTNSQIKNKLNKSRSLTPKSLKESKIENLKDINNLLSNEANKDNNQSVTDIFNHEKKDNIDSIMFYNGKLSDFISIYSSYFQTIPEEQKVIFNLRQNILDYIHNNFYPKIIVYGDKKMKLIKGLCIVSHIFWKKNELFIEHISSYKDEEKEKIYEMFFSFIKENSYIILGYDNNIKENDIYIDLYYKNKEEKFIINEGIRDYFRKELKFKWVKLVNLSKYERYIEMRHHFSINNENNANILANEYDDNNVLNQSILGRKEFNNDDANNNSEDEEKSDNSDNINLDISTAFDIYKNINNDNNTQEINNNLYKNRNMNLLNNFSIKNKTIMKFNNKIYENHNNKNENIRYSNPLNFVYLLHKIHNDINNKDLYELISNNINSYFSENDTGIIEQVLQKYTKIKTNLIVENSNYYSDVSDLSKQIKNKFKLNVIINALLPFENCISFIYNEYHYNRIKVPKLQIFKERITQQIFYMISKSENHVVLISSDLNDAFKDKYINNNTKDNISINFMNIYNNLSNVDDINNNILYIPAFEVKCKYVNNCYNKIPPDKKYNLYCYEDYYNIKFFTEELSMNKNIKNNKIKSNNFINVYFDYDIINDEQINQPTFIKNDFLLIVFDLNIMEQLRDFPLLSFFITKDNFIHK